MYNVHLMCIEKLLVEFLLVIIELFSIGAMAEALRANINWKSVVVFEGCGQVWLEISGRTNRSLCWKTRCIDLSYDMKMWAELLFVLSQFTRLTD